MMFSARIYFVIAFIQQSLMVKSSGAPARNKDRELLQEAATIFENIATRAEASIFDGRCDSGLAPMLMRLQPTRRETRAPNMTCCKLSDYANYGIINYHNYAIIIP